MVRNENEHIGSTLDSFLKDEKTFSKITALAQKKLYL